MILEGELTLDDVIAKLLEAKEHCVEGKSTICVYSKNEHTIFQGRICDVDYDNKGINLYFNKDE